jgi:hypothetical protein
MNGHHPALAILVATVVVGLACSGCGRTPEDTTSKADGQSTRHTKAVRFSECMRDNGVKDFPDPDASGSLTLDGVLNGSSLDSDSAAWKKAIRTCKDLQPAGFTGRKRSDQQQSAALEFAQCIRDHGVKDFPDPVAGEPLVNTNLIPSTDEKGGMTILNAAMHTCGKLSAGKLGLTGQ